MGRSPPLRPCAKYTRLKRGMNSVLTESKAKLTFFFPSPLRGSLLNTFTCDLLVKYDLMIFISFSTGSVQVLRGVLLI